MGRRGRGARGIHVAGYDHPWKVTIATLKDAPPPSGPTPSIEATPQILQTILQTAFGEKFDQTIVMEIDVTVLTDVKLRLTEKVTMEVEVGVAGKYEYFKSIGGRGRMVLPPNGTNGFLIDMVLVSSTRTVAPTRTTTPTGRPRPSSTP